MTTKEQYYDERIAPKIADLALECHDQGLSLVVACEWEPGEYGSTRLLQPNTGIGLLLTDAAARANGNVDSLLMAIIKHAKEHGHGSIYLSRLGVPTEPASKEQGQ